MLINMTLASIFGREFANSPITFINCREILLPRQSLEREKKLAKDGVEAILEVEDVGASLCIAIARDDCGSDH